MREIKFRGRRIDNGEWVYGYYIRSTDGRSFIGSEMYVDKRGEFSTAAKTFNAIEVNPKTVGQFTGLKDKNKKDIYPKDLVKVIFNERIKVEPIMEGGDIGEEDIVVLEKSEIIGEVRMRTMGGVGFVIKSIRTIKDDNDRRRRELGINSTFEGKFHRFKLSKMENVEVIGNIYENKELLTNK